MVIFVIVCLWCLRGEFVFTNSLTGDGGGESPYELGCLAPGGRLVGAK